MAVRHGKSNTSIYHRWEVMIARCYNPRFAQYKDYGGRGIQVCDRWRDFVNFYEDMGDPPEGHQLDRIDNDGDYGPENCRWVTPRQNMRNRNRVSKTGYVGVEQGSRNSFRARIHFANGVPPVNVGSFPTAQEAHEARERKLEELGLR